MEKELLAKKPTQFITRVRKPYPIMTKIAKINALRKNGLIAYKTIPLSTALTYIAHLRDTSPPLGTKPAHYGKHTETSLLTLSLSLLKCINPFGIIKVVCDLNKLHVQIQFPFSTSLKFNIWQVI